MQEVLLPPSDVQGLPFSEFLAALFQALQGEGLRYCVLRNYDGFPDTNLGNDLDLLILPSELPRARRALGSIQGIRIVGYSERQFVANFFLEGVSSTLGFRSIQVDFFWSLSCKGLPYLATDTVLQSAIQRWAGNLDFFIPSSIHEAIISLFASLLVGKWIKEKYFPQVQRTFASNRSEVLAVLVSQFELKAATRLVDAVIDGDRSRVLGCIRPLRVSLALRSLSHKPIRGALAIARYYMCEAIVSYSPVYLEMVCILGPHGCGKTTLIKGLIPMLHSSAQTLENSHFDPLRPTALEAQEMNGGADYRIRRQGVMIISMAKAVQRLVEEWLNQFTGRRNLKLCIRDSCCYELAIAPERCRYYGPAWFARLVGKLSPSLDLWILLAPAETGSLPSHQEVLPAGTLRILEAYRSFVKTRKKYVILDTSKPADSVKEEAYAAIIDTFAQRTDVRLKNRF
jgi:energy-coupling factor transporter ATP-binding protein EcfA2